MQLAGPGPGVSTHQNGQLPAATRERSQALEGAQMPSCSDPLRPQVPFPSQTLLSPQTFLLAEPRDCTRPCGERILWLPIVRNPLWLQRGDSMQPNHPNHIASGRTKETSSPANPCPKSGSEASAWGSHTLPTPAGESTCWAPAVWQVWSDCPAGHSGYLPSTQPFLEEPGFALLQDTRILLAEPLFLHLRKGITVLKRRVLHP